MKKKNKWLISFLNLELSRKTILKLGTTFWGTNPENNYGFGTSNISANIENRKKTPIPNVGNANQNIWNRNQYQTPTPSAKQRASVRNNQSSQTKPVYKNPNPKRYSTGDIILSALEGFIDGGKAIVQREAEIISQIPNRLTSLKRTTYNLANNYSQVMNSPQEFQNQDPISVKNSTLENAINFLKQYKLITDKKLSDVNKHQYMSCLAGKDGLALGVTGLALGVGKEAFDLTRKYFNEEQNKAYGGWTGILADSTKDMTNNNKGFVHGFVNNQPCYPLLKKTLP